MFTSLPPPKKLAHLLIIFIYVSLWYIISDLVIHSCRSFVFHWVKWAFSFDSIKWDQKFQIQIFAEKSQTTRWVTVQCFSCFHVKYNWSFRFWARSPNEKNTSMPTERNRWWYASISIFGCYCRKAALSSCIWLPRPSTMPRPAKLARPRRACVPFWPTFLKIALGWRHSAKRVWVA